VNGFYIIYQTRLSLPHLLMSPSRLNCISDGICQLVPTSPVDVISAEFSSSVCGSPPVWCDLLGLLELGSVRDSEGVSPRLNFELSYVLIEGQRPAGAVSLTTLMQFRALATPMAIASV
jgi:hypothetical protein